MSVEDKSSFKYLEISDLTIYNSLCFLIYNYKLIIHVYLLLSDTSGSICCDYSVLNIRHLSLCLCCQDP